MPQNQFMRVLTNINRIPHLKVWHIALHTIAIIMLLTLMNLIESRELLHSPQSPKCYHCDDDCIDYSYKFVKKKKNRNNNMQ